MATITSAEVGTELVSGPGTLAGLLVTVPFDPNADHRTPLTLIDATAANPTGRGLFSASLNDLNYLYGTVPGGLPMTPGAPTPPPTGTLFANKEITFERGLYVLSCPQNVTFTSS
jgi:hypothetical protein